MEHSTNYETDTLKAYRSRQRATEYKRYHTTAWNWARISTWREQWLLSRELSRYSWSADDRILDIPCGTGILGKLFYSFPFQIVASDISLEMMELAREEYPADRLIDCVQSDITRTGFPPNSFDCVVVLGFLHRVPRDIKRAALREVSALTKRVVIITCSVDSSLQRLKRKFLAIVKGSNLPAPCPAPLREIIVVCEAAGLKVVRSSMVVPFLSAEAMLVLEKSESSSS
jgi:SAM-dependent methyltransferase